MASPLPNYKAEAVQTLLDFLSGSLKKTPGYDRKVEAAAALLFGNGDSELGRLRLAALALAEPCAIAARADKHPV